MWADTKSKMKLTSKPILALLLFVGGMVVQGCSAQGEQQNDPNNSFAEVRAKRKAEREAKAANSPKATTGN